MIKIGKICLLTEGEISELNKKFLEIETKLEQISFDLAKNFREHDTISRVFDRFDTKNFVRIKRMRHHHADAPAREAEVAHKTLRRHATSRLGQTGQR